MKMDSLNLFWTILFIFFNIQVPNSGSTSLSSNQNNDDDAQDAIRCKTELNARKLAYIWTISNFSYLEQINRDNIPSLYSPKFSPATNDGCQWYLRLYPNGNLKSRKNTIAIFLYQHADKTVDQVSVKMDYYILNNQQEEIWSKKDDEIFEFNLRNTGSGWGENILLIKDEYFRDHLLQNDTLILKVKIWYCIPCTSMKCVPKRLNMTSTSSELNTMGNDLVENLQSLFENPSFADIIISVPGKNFWAHKNILAARSSIFADRISQIKTTDKLGRIFMAITDMDEEVAGEILRYIYTGKCKNITRLAKGLLVAANKYALKPLKKICAQKIRETLSVENAADLLVFADKNEADELKSQVIEFIVGKSSQVLNSANWKNKVKSNPELVNEVCRALAQVLNGNSEDNNNMIKVCGI